MEFSFSHSPPPPLSLGAGGTNRVIFLSFYAFDQYNDFSQICHLSAVYLVYTVNYKFEDFIVANVKMSFVAKIWPGKS